MRVSPYVVAIFAFAVAAGCGSKDEPSNPQSGATKQLEPVKIPAGQEATIMPLAVGNQWVYHLANVSGAGRVDDEITFRVTSITPKGNGSIANVEVTNKTGMHEPQTWVLDDKGFFVTEATSDRHVFNPPQPMVVFPLADGQSFKWTGTGPRPARNPGPSTLEGKLIGSQEVDTAMGTMAGYCVETTTTWTEDGKQGGMVAASWYAPKVGLVRLNRRVVTAQGGASEQTMRLRSYSLKP